MGPKNTSGYRLFLLAILSIALTACGGGGGSGDAPGGGASASFAPFAGIMGGSGNDTIRKITPAGAVSMLVGVAVSGTSLYITLRSGVAVVQNLP